MTKFIVRLIACGDDFFSRPYFGDEKQVPADQRKDKRTRMV